MLLMRPSCYKGDPHVRNGRPRQDTYMLLFFQMSQYQPLPVPVQHVFTTGRAKLQAAPLFPWLQQQMYFCIVPQRFKMSHTLCRFCDCFFVYNVFCPKFYVYMKSFSDQMFQYLDLHFPHELGMDLP